MSVQHPFTNSSFRRRYRSISLGSSGFYFPPPSLIVESERSCLASIYGTRFGREKAQRRNEQRLRFSGGSHACAGLISRDLNWIESVATDSEFFPSSACGLWRFILWEYIAALNKCIARF